VQREAFKHLYLTKVNVSHNLIETIGEGVFRNAENMTILDMSHNRIAEILETSFDENSYATEWRLEFNNLTSMSQVRQKCPETGPNCIASIIFSLNDPISTRKPRKWTMLQNKPILFPGIREKIAFSSAMRENADRWLHFSVRDCAAS
jgi:Leucine-rich repeat (LRR) protein